MSDKNIFPSYSKIKNDAVFEEMPDKYEAFPEDLFYLILKDYLNEDFIESSKIFDISDIHNSRDNLDKIQEYGYYFANYFEFEKFPYTYLPKSFTLMQDYYINELKEEEKQFYDYLKNTNDYNFHIRNSLVSSMRETYSYLKEISFATSYICFYDFLQKHNLPGPEIYFLRKLDEKKEKKDLGKLLFALNSEKI